MSFKISKRIVKKCKYFCCLKIIQVFKSSFYFGSFLPRKFSKFWATKVLYFTYLKDNIILETLKIITWA